MTAFETIFYLIQNLLCIYISVRGMDLFLGKSNKNTKLCSVAVLIYWIENSLLYLIFGNATINLISSTLGSVFVSVVSYKAPIWKKLLAALSVHAFLVMIDNSVWFWVMIHFKHSIFTADIFVLLVLLIVEIIAEQCFALKEQTPVPRGYYFSMLMIPVGSMILNYILMESEEIYADNVSLAIGTIVIVVMNGFMLYFFENLVSSIQEKREKDLLEQKILMYENQMEILSQAREKERALRHDLKNHLHLLSEFEKNGKHEEALFYIEVMDEFVDVKEEIVSTGNEQIDAILNYMLEKAKKLGAALDIKVNIPKTEFCSVFDLNVILSNLLENAIEAMETYPEKKVQLIMEFDKGVLYIRVGNSFDGQIKKEGNRYLTKKADSYSHGIGLKNVHEIAEKYQGTVKTMLEENMFYVDIVMYINELQLS